MLRKHWRLRPLSLAYIPVYSTLLDQDLSTRKPIEWHRLARQVEVPIRDYFSTGKNYLSTIIKSQLNCPLDASL